MPTANSFVEMKDLEQIPSDKGSCGESYQFSHAPLLFRKSIIEISAVLPPVFALNAR